MDPSDHDRNDPDNGTLGDHRPTHTNGVQGEEGGWLRSAMQYSSEIIKVVDLDGTLRYASPAFGRVFGYDPEEAAGTMNVLDLVHPEDLPRVLAETEKALSSGGVVSNRAEYRFRHEDGSWRWVEGVGTYLPDDPAVRGVVVSVREITERKEAEEKIRFQAQLLGAVGEAVVAVDVDGRVVYWNRAAERVYGWSAEEIMGRHLREMVVPEDLRGRAEEIMVEVRAGSTWSGEFMLRRRDGSSFLAEAVNTPVFGGDGGLRSVISVLRDVTESRETEKALKESEAELFSVLESITDGFFILDREWRFAYANPQAALMLNRDREDLVGERLWEDETFYPEYRRAVKENRTVEFEGYYPHLGRWFGIRAYPSETGLSVYVQDVTERKEAERRLSEAEERYRTLVEQVPAIAYVRHHERGSLGGVTYVSPQVEAVLGYTQEEYASESQFWKTIVHPDDRERVLAEDERAAETGESFELDYRLIAKDTGTVWIRESGTLVRREDDGTQVWHGIMFDISETKRVEGELREAEARYRILVERVSPTIYIERPRKGEIAAYDTTYISPRVEDLLGYPPQRFVEDPGYWNSLIHPEDLEAVQREDARTDESGEPFSIEYRVRAADGRTVWIRDEATLVRNEAGRASYWLGVRTDITGRKEAEERYRTLVERMPAVTYIEEVGETHRTLYMSPQIEDMLGYPQEDWLGGIHHWTLCLHPEDRERVLAEDARSNSTGEPFKAEYRMLRRDGETVWVRDEAVLVEGPGGRGRFWQGVITDITGRKALEARLEHQALHDTLTGLPNRRLFMDRLGQALARTRRGGGVAVLFLDLDDFKVVNDSLGHEAGDLLLTVVAQRLGRCLRPEDTLARFGGDEFVVLLEEVGDPSEAVRVAQRITDELRRPFNLDGRELYASASVGISFGTARSKSPEALLRDADTAMYRAKEGGADFRVFDPAMYERVVRRLDLENDLRRAVEQGEFVLHYQPIFDFGSQRVWGTEALVRWAHPERGLLGPPEFVPLAEETGLIIPVGNWALEEACRRTKEWQDRLPRDPPLGVIVNLSARQLRHPKCEETIRETLSRSGLSPESLSLDVTETAFIDALEDNRLSLERIQASGVRISIDDFGMGYSSLSYLKRLPADALKIDKSFLKGFGEDVEDTAIVRMVIEVGHTLGLRVVAEGVETWTQAALLAETGCDMAQGYHFSKPLLPEEVQTFLGEQSA